MSTSQHKSPRLVHGLWIMLGASVLSAWIPSMASASCGDYLRAHGRILNVVHQHGELPAEPLPSGPCRCRGPECRSVPLSPIPAETPTTTRLALEPAWWMGQSVLSPASHPSAGSIPSDELRPNLVARSIEHVPIV